MLLGQLLPMGHGPMEAYLRLIQEASWFHLKRVRVDLRPEKDDLRPTRANLRLQRTVFKHVRDDCQSGRGGRIKLGPKMADLRIQRTYLRCERANLGPAGLCKA